MVSTHQHFKMVGGSAFHNLEQKRGAQISEGRRRDAKCLFPDFSLEHGGTPGTGNGDYCLTQIRAAKGLYNTTSEQANFSSLRPVGKKICFRYAAIN